MKISVVGAHNTESRNSRYMTLLVDDVLALDAGGLTSSLTFEDQMKLKAVLITHQHYDHLRDIPALAMNFFLHSRQIDLYSHPAVFDALTRHLLNGLLYSEFHKKPEDNPALRFHVLEPLREVIIEGFLVKPVPMNHSQPTMGFQLSSPDKRRIFYTGDTGIGLEDAWPQIDPDLLFIELTAPNRWESSMIAHKHLTPSLLQRELSSFRDLKGYLPRVVAVHMNPNAESEIANELKPVAETLGIDIRMACEGMEIEV